MVGRVYRWITCIQFSATFIFGFRFWPPWAVAPINRRTSLLSRAIGTTCFNRLMPLLSHFRKYLKSLLLLFQHPRILFKKQFEASWKPSRPTWSLLKPSWSDKANPPSTSTVVPNLYLHYRTDYPYVLYVVFPTTALTTGIVPHKGITA